MNIKLYCVLPLFFILSQTAIAQPRSNAQKEFNKLSDSYQSKQVSAEEYFKQANLLTHQLLSEGKHFETKELVHLLNLYEEIAWSKPEYGRARVSYFFLFFNNARMFKKKGASMYYAEKVTAEYKKYGEAHPLIEQLQKTKIYQEMRLYPKIIEIYNTEKKYLESLPELLRNHKVDGSVGLNAMYILSPVLEGYIKLNDSKSVQQTAHLARQIGTALARNPSSTRPQLLYNELLMIDIDHSLANFERKYEVSKTLLHRMAELKTKYKDQTTNFIEFNLVRLRMENYLNLKNRDSLRHYIAKYESSPNFGKSQSAELAEFKAKLNALEGDYRNAYLSVNDALKYEREMQTSLMAESSDLLYAYTQAEHSSIALEKTEKAKQQRTVLLVLISVSALIVIFIIYVITSYRSRKAKAQIEALNSAADMQIIAIEEVKHQAVKEEQRRLGQDLHDGLSSSIAAIRHQLETLTLETDDITLKNKLGRLQTETERAYEVARKKSHEWFSAADQQQEQSFEKQIRILTDSALPDSRYNKTIQIDDSSLTGVSTDMRITLLRIVQEAITNIIKHAKAKNVGILIYEEEDTLLLTINDDGVGLNETKTTSKKSAIGLESIRRRVEYLNGELNIDSDINGTEIMVSIPLK
ncbi:signal transduction histidine kinase [Pedobacter africanus]|uniref:Signal transduction histidine kinase n=1 Tax=Pedobacter africanus TaxID=151894 RepID=A0ACC6L575_9SPHI|nr:ATP-binding protein [Pedobacter africanus]MDR6786649.1 signal transduction histidine kinase [Pedobacter africanus]